MKEREERVIYLVEVDIITMELTGRAALVRQTEVERVMGPTYAASGGICGAILVSSRSWDLLGLGEPLAEPVAQPVAGHA